MKTTTTARFQELPVIYNMLQSRIYKQLYVPYQFIRLVICMRNDSNTETVDLIYMCLFVMLLLSKYK